MYCRYACSIPDPSSATVLVTGGYYTLNTVSRYCTVLYCNCRYGLEGWLEDLPPLNMGRYYHGCGGYVSGGDLVSAVHSYLL